MSADNQQPWESSEPIPLRAEPESRTLPARQLGDLLRQWRTERNLSLREAAPFIRGSVSKISRLERGEYSLPKERDVWDLVRGYGVPESEHDDVHELLRQTRLERKGLRYSDVTPGYLRRLVSLEASATRILTYQSHVVPGLLQIRDYARLLVKAAMPDADSVTIERHVRDRLVRAELFDDAQRPEVVVVIDESVLRRNMGDPAMMCEQLKHLRRAADEETSHVSIHIIPFDGDGASRAPSFPLTHLHLADGGPTEVVYVEHMESAEYITHPKKLAQYRTVVTELMGHALSRSESIAFLDDMIQRYEEKHRRP
ncbi:helix-turn-helix domain-containing protein [Streptomyces sp. NPDC058001]|uniref:helix-turn-helix domain-containing protein n=1 Tax=Streptomyces sp. NPDC058001 TaxID=3346300 RepID=UPI0036E4C0F0